jgi:hypothetical protein
MSLSFHPSCRYCPRFARLVANPQVYIDGGARRGTDVIKALCLGAKGVGMGRPFLYSLTYGEEGVVHAIESMFCLPLPLALDWNRRSNGENRTDDTSYEG